MTFAFDPSSTLGISLVLDQYLLCGAGSYTMWQCKFTSVKGQDFCLFFFSVMDDSSPHPKF